MKNIELESKLNKLGWSRYSGTPPTLTDEGNLYPARVIEVNRNSFIVDNGIEELRVTAAGKFAVRDDGIFPVTGDWVLCENTTIQEVLKRKNSLSRGASGNRKKQGNSFIKEQFIAANIDSVFIVCGLDRDFNPRRVERYLTLIYNNGLSPVIVLTKGDLHSNPYLFAIQIDTIAAGVPIHIVSAEDQESLEDLKKYLTPNQTISLLGSSGAGKSTLVNRLADIDIQATSEVSSSVGKGRHTTTTRSLIKIPSGGMIIDNPGIREITFSGDEEGLQNSFPEIEAKSSQCRFSDCTHNHEPGCIVIDAVNRGEIEQSRLASYHKMKRELNYFSQRETISSERIEKDRRQHIAKKAKELKKSKFRR